MKSLQLANHLKMPVLGLGTWKSAPGEVAAAVESALELGYRHFDCAPVYGNEKEIGAVFAAAIASSNVAREDLWVTSKLWNSDHLPEQVIPALKRTLHDLKLDFLDLYMIHWPIAHRAGVQFPSSADDFLSPEQAPFAETWNALQECVEQGLCKSLGVANFNLMKLETLRMGNWKHQPLVNQVECHPLLAQNDLLEFCQLQGIVLTAYSPLGSPDRPERLKRGDEPAMMDSPVIAEIAAAHAASPAQILLAWGICRGTIVIPKSTHRKRQQENLAAVEIELSPEEMQQINQMDRGYRYIDGATWELPGGPYTREQLWNQ